MVSINLLYGRLASFLSSSLVSYYSHRVSAENAAVRLHSEEELSS